MDVEQRVASALRSVLPVGTSIDVTMRDTAMRVRVATQEILAVWLSVGTTAAVRKAWVDVPDVQLVVAPRLSPGAREIVREIGLGWLDELGGAEFVAGNVVVSRTGQAAQGRRSTTWTPSTLGVAEALLTGTRATVAALHQSTQASPSTVASALALLTDAGLLRASAARGRSSGRTVEEPLALLNAYSVAAADLDVRHALTVGAQWRDPLDGVARLGAELDGAGIEWAATGALAAAIQAPYQTQVAPWVVYVRAATVADLLTAAAVGGMQPIQGGRLELRAFPSAITARLSTEQTGVRVVPWPRAYADLRWTGVRGEGAADHLAATMIGEAHV